MFRFRRPFAVLLLAMSITPQCRAAFVWAEVGEAGELPPTAQIVFGAGELLAITGTIFTSMDVDMYRISITAPVIFSASTVGTPGSLADSQLFLFTTFGLGIAANDDDSAVTTRSALPAGNPLTSVLLPGDYVIGISGWDRDPVSPGGLIFPPLPKIGVFGPVGPGGAFPMTGSSGIGISGGTYEIVFKGAAAAAAAVPEPSTLLQLGIVGLLALGANGWRSRARAA